MPHLAVEYSPGVSSRTEISALCRALHAAMIDTEIFPLAGIRVRAYCADFAIVADGLPENDFVAMTLAVGAGRPAEALKVAGDIIFAAAQSVLADLLSTTHFALSLEIRVIDPELSWKDTPIHTRLSGQK
ncbi:5-carboxymethyl-2-hydroxymuconate isomerase [Martelella alba]|uniref:5-carboxymethyl-2-hydroxymuconate isomerase n=1 Tax=Martelella alba TaxID=2590451 RepID=A0A506UGC8_9HYPH|nr:5-carboxymethyl-2-hydroxymuconate Delta-isomerase [Martelella alba]TPW31057.1 5-carboxymethyl-2-hydroxymuconate isomerase [Martelella alba]